MATARNRQSDEQRAALDRAFRAERRQRMVRMAAAMLVAAILAGVYVWFTTGNGAVVERNRMQGTVLSWTRSQGYTGASTLLITVKLANAREIVAQSERTLAPATGAEVEVQENVYESGARVFFWPVDRQR